MAGVPNATWAGPPAEDPTDTKQTSPREERKQRADKLFREAYELWKGAETQAQRSRACKLFGDSHQLNPEAGTLLNLARCAAWDGHTATAWRRYRQAEALARSTGSHARAEAARKRAAALEPKLSWLTIVVPTSIADLVVELDSHAIEASDFAIAQPIDPGRHELVARAPHRKTWRRAITIENAGERRHVEIPLLDQAAPKPAGVKNQRRTPPQPSPGESSTPWFRYLGLGLTGVGVLGVGVGAELFNQADDDDTEASLACGGQACTATTQALADPYEQSAQDKRLGATVVAVAGATLVLTGLVMSLWPTGALSPAPEQANNAGLDYLGPIVGRGLAGLTAGGRF